MLGRVQARLHKTTEEIRDNLLDLEVVRLPGTDIVRVSADSRSADFAKDFINALIDED